MSKLFFVAFLCLIISVFATTPDEIGCTDISQAEFDEKNANCIKCGEEGFGEEMVKRCRNKCFTDNFYQSCVDQLNGVYEEKDTPPVKE
uniref:Alpha-latrotoxin associated low molecular weight protein n=1 Tax=Latrodectus hesperus TaxID=256737 RepID=TXA1_LATHE|nr:RecName: Full=Alpha-latrotoxin associated low molecular weight protein; Short=Alpha-latrotoxin-associated LMWP; AltName: Full=Latrodectin-1; Short=Latrodectin; Flags: Precursor [Latrodectus hesperus]AHC13253.1 alpha-latrotoxin associated low molecular weight protein [Latrodectus hesperus]